MDWLDFFIAVIVFYSGMACGIWFAGMGRAAKDDPHNEPHGM